MDEATLDTKKPKQYKPRFRRREGADERGYNVTRNKLDILEKIYSFERIRTSHLRLLLPQYEASLGDTLTILHDEGLIDKESVPLGDPDKLKMAAPGITYLAEQPRLSCSDLPKKALSSSPTTPSTISKCLPRRE